MNGSEAGKAPSSPDEDFSFTIAKAGQGTQAATEYFEIEEPEIERWNFTWYEGKLAKSQHYFRFPQIKSTNLSHRPIC